MNRTVPLNDSIISPGLVIAAERLGNVAMRLLRPARRSGALSVLRKRFCSPSRALDIASCNVANGFSSRWGIAAGWQWVQGSRQR